MHIGHNEDVHKAMIDCIGSDEYCKYPPPEGFTELQSLILKDLDSERLDVKNLSVIKIIISLIFTEEFIQNL